MLFINKLNQKITVAKTFLSIVMLVMVTFSYTSNAKSNELASTTNINSNWLYLENDASNPAQIPTNPQWQQVSVPHTWNAFDTMDATPGYRRDASWYKKTLVIDAASIKDNRYVLYFEGVNMESEVYVNGHKAGEHIGGYLGFEIEITPFLNLNGINEVLVRASNAYNPNLIPSQKSDFFIYGGIIRDVWLKKLPLNYIASVQIDTPQVSTASAKTKISLSVNANVEATQKIRFSLIDPQQYNVASFEKKVHLKRQVNEVIVDFNEVKQPQLWSPETPNLYTVSIQLLSEQGTVLQEIQHKFGYRWFEMQPKKGFFVNGKRTLIRGTHRHEEHAGYGGALPNEIHYQDMKQIKDMGANFVRLAHYPQDPEVYKAADELGLILWDELPWCRGGKGGKAWEINTESLLKQQIQQNRNHPSIAFWSLGNEIDWEADFPGGTDNKKITPYLKKLNAMTKQLDPSRITTIRKYYDGAEVVDAFSPSIWAGWYGGSYGQYGEALKLAMEKYPTFLHMEYGASSHVGRHEETPISKDGMSGVQVSVSEAMNQAVVKSIAKDSNWNENYAVDLFDWHLFVSENTPNFAGNAQWAFKDFGTPLRPENPIPYVNQKGLVDRSGKPKDAYYVFASYWAKKPFCYIESKTWTHREGPKEGRDVSVYCNTVSAELFLNGKSLGKKLKNTKAFPAGGLVWKVPFVNGNNKLFVKGISKDNIEVTDSLDVHYLIGKHGPIEQIKLSSKPLTNGNLLIEAEAIDAKGNRVLDYEQRSYFSNMTDNGYFKENLGTPNGSSIIEMANGYAAIEFVPSDKPTTIEYRNQNIKGVYLKISGK